MEQKLRLAFRDPHLASALKALTAAAAFAFAVRTNFSVFGIVGALALIFYFFQSSGSGSVRFRYFFAVYFASTVTLLYLLESFDVRFLIYLVAGGIFYIVLGVRELLFVRRQEWNYALRLIVSYLLFLSLSLLDTTTHFFAATAIATLLFYLLWKEFFGSRELPAPCVNFCRDLVARKTLATQHYECCKFELPHGLCCIAPCVALHG
jgi:hypothetical protein